MFHYFVLEGSIPECLVVNPAAPERPGGAGLPGGAGKDLRLVHLTGSGFPNDRNHGHVLLSVAQDPGIRVADIAGRVGITPRAALQILKDLEDGGYLHRTRVGRRTRYTIEPHQHFRHPSTASQEVDGLIRLFSGTAPGTTAEPHVDR